MADAPTVQDRTAGDTSIGAKTTGTQGLSDLSFGIGENNLGDLVGPKGVLTEQTGQYVKEAGNIRRSMISGAEADAENVRRAYHAEGVGPDELKPWNAEAQREKFMTKPVDAFGSIGSVFGIIASAFTHQPMQNALDASAAAMNAIRAGDREKYEDALAAWKDNTALALKRHQLQHEQYQDAMELMKTNMALGKAKLDTLFAQYGDAKLYALSQAGYDEQLFKGIQSRAEAAKSLQAIHDSDFDRALINRVYESQAEQIDKETKQTEDQIKQSGAPPENQKMWLDALNAKRAAQKLHAAAQSNFLLKELQSGDPKWHLMGEWMLNNPKDADDPDKVSAQMQKFGLTVPYLRGISGTYDKVRFIQEQEDAYLSTQGVTRENATADQLRMAHEFGVARERAAQHPSDPALVKQFEHYPEGVDPGNIPVKQQERLRSAWDSAQSLEAIAEFVKEHPDAVGLIAKASRQLNLDAYQGLMSNLPALKNKTEEDRDRIIDKLAKGTQATNAKILNKMLTTQAFNDAAASGSRGATIYLDRAFKEIYDQASSLPGFFGVLEKRYDDANRVWNDYDLPFDNRDDVVERLPFWKQKTKGALAEIASGKITKPSGVETSTSPPPGAIAVPDAQKNDPDGTVYNNGKWKKQGEWMVPQ